LDQLRLYFVYIDTVSFTFAVAGDLSIEFEQNSEVLTKDRELYDKDYPLFFPKDKTLLTLEHEHCGYDMIALATRNFYTTEQSSPEWFAAADLKKETVKQKGVTIDKNRNTE
jgi:hypothetical protein